MSNILVVEDNESLNDVYKIILTKAGHKVVTAFNGIEALKTLKTFKPDVILLDMLMPEMGGIAFIKKYNPSKKSNAKIIILSNLDEDQGVKEAQRYGVTDYVLKASLSPSELITKVNQVLDAPAVRLKK